MSQGAKQLPSGSSDDEDIYQAMLADMKIYREILKSIWHDLRSMNLEVITDEDIEKYRSQINDAVEYVANSDITDANNVLMIYRFITVIKEFNKIGNLIIRKFKLALSRWEEFHDSKKDVQQRDAAEEVYGERLNECHTELARLLDLFKDF